MSNEKKAIAILLACLVVIGVGLFLAGDKDPPAELTRGRLSALQSSIEAWCGDHGRLPDSLEELGLASEAIRDHMGTVFDYTVTEDGRVTLTSYGADGKPGGHMFRADIKVTFEVSVPAP